MSGHSKKVNLLTFNSAAEGILASTALDMHVLTWDIFKGKYILDIKGSEKDYATDIAWNYDGSLIGSSWKDKFVRIIDPRANKIVYEVPGHDGAKPTKFSWMGTNESFLSFGFSKSFDREFKMWDIKKLDKPA